LIVPTGTVALAHRPWMAASTLRPDARGIAQMRDSGPGGHSSTEGEYFESVEVLALATAAVSRKRSCNSAHR